jgi:hypothetical protein
MEFIKIAELEKNETETDETVTYQHQCSECSHKIADHEYTFTIDGEYQEYAMVRPVASLISRFEGTTLRIRSRSPPPIMLP